ncbi:Murein DD-endopeptidase MepM [bacterium YEK0313]|nr:Murein DD-endopeptidase MepM [bacterium YEK0313]
MIKVRSTASHAPSRPRQTRPAPKTSRLREFSVGRGTLFVIIFVFGLVAAWGAGMTYLLFAGNRLAASAVQRTAELQDYYEQQAAEYRRSLAAAQAEANRAQRDLDRLSLDRTGVEGRLVDLARRQSQIETRQSAFVRLAEQIGGAPIAALGAGLGRAGSDAMPLPVARPGGERARTRSILPEADVPEEAVNLDPDAEPAELPDPDRHHGEAGDAAMGAARSLASPTAALAGQDVAEVAEQLDRRIRQAEADQVKAVQAMGSATRARAHLLRQAFDVAGRELTEIVEPVRSRAAGAVAAATRRAAEDASPFGLAIAEIRQNAAVIKRLSPTIDALPLHRPVSQESRISSRWGLRSDPFLGTSRMHAGQDFAAPLGTPVFATGGGVVLSAGWGGGYGNLVQVDHGNGLVTRYAHLSEILVTPGQPVAAGARVGLVGSTGRSTGAHLHYETRLRGTSNDPMRFLRVGEELGMAVPRLR